MNQKNQAKVWEGGTAGAAQKEAQAAMQKAATVPATASSVEELNKAVQTAQNAAKSSGSISQNATPVQPQPAQPNVAYPTATSAAAQPAAQSAAQQPQSSQTSSGSIQITETTERNLEDLSPLINEMYDKVDSQIRTNVNRETQLAADQLQRALQDAQPTYTEAIARQLLEEKQARDAQALYNQVQGNRGGLGAAQLNSIANTGAKNREAIAAEQRKLATDTARQLADLRARGKYTEADELLSSAQARLSALYEEQVRLQEEQNTRRDILANLGNQFMQSGVMPSQDMLDAMGIDAAAVQAYIDRVNAPSAGNSSGSSGRGSNGGTYVYKDEPIEDEPVNIPTPKGATVDAAERESLLAAIRAKGNLQDGLAAIAGRLLEMEERGVDMAELYSYLKTNAFPSSGGGVTYGPGLSKRGFAEFMTQLNHAYSLYPDRIDRLISEQQGNLNQEQWNTVMQWVRARVD